MSRQSLRPGVKRVYEPPEASDGTRVLVDRVWPRGLTKEHASVNVWLGNEACALPIELPRDRRLGGSRVSSRRNCGNGNDNSTAFPNAWRET
jgi:Protein of unknown function, DUF488